MEQGKNSAAVALSHQDLRQPLDLSEVKPASTADWKMIRRLYARMSSDAKRTVLGWLTTLIPTVLVQLTLHNILLTMLVFSLPFLGWGIRLVPKFHCGLLTILWVRRTKIGFCEGMVWVPWFLGAKLDFYNTQKRKLDIPKEDNWTTDTMHLVYDIVLQYGITPIVDDGFWKNFFQFFISIFKGLRNAQSLYDFSDQIDLKSAIEVMASDASDLTIKAVNSRGFAEIFSLKDDGQISLKENTIQEEVIIKLNRAIKQMGLTIYKYNLKDIDFHEDTAVVLQEKFLAQVRGEASENLYEVIIRVAKNMIKEGLDVTDAAIRIEVVEALKAAAKGDGVIGLLLQSLAVKNTLPAKA